MVDSGFECLQNVDINASDVVENCEKFFFVILIRIDEWLPILLVESNELGCEELLQRPASLEPLTILQLRDIGNVCKVNDSDSRLLVPGKHRDDRFLKFGVVRLIDTTRITPCPPVAFFLRRSAELLQLANFTWGVHLINAALNLPILRFIFRICPLVGKHRVSKEFVNSALELRHRGDRKILIESLVLLRLFENSLEVIVGVEDAAVGVYQAKR